MKSVFEDLGGVERNLLATGVGIGAMIVGNVSETFETHGSLYYATSTTLFLVGAVTVFVGGLRIGRDIVNNNDNY